MCVVFESVEKSIQEISISLSARISTLVLSRRSVRHMMTICRRSRPLTMTDQLLSGCTATTLLKAQRMAATRTEFVVFRKAA